MKRNPMLAAAALLACATLGLIIHTATAAEKADEKPPAKPKPVWMTPDDVNKALKAKNPKYKNDGRFLVDKRGYAAAAELSGTAVTDLSPLAGVPFMALDARGLKIRDLAPLKGMPLVKLFLEDTLVDDISALKGAKLDELYLSNTKVKDLSALSGMPLTSLNLLGTPAEDVTPLKGLPLKMLWLNETKVADLRPIAACPLVSLTLHKTPVSDLRPLSTNKTLRRLHVGETAVKDLTPITGLGLTRLIFTPSKIEKGLDEVRKMETLTEVGTSFETRMPPARFWRLYDSGKSAGQQ